jgi:ATPase subunit of ABC transporter with duplicated ATPase domains
MIELRGLSHGFLRKSLFQDVSIRLLPNARYGIVGANGSGKSTLLRIMAGEFEADSGEVYIEGDASLFRIGQDHNLNDEISIIDTAMMGQIEVYSAIKRKDELLEQGDNPDVAKELTHLEDIIHNRGGYRLRSSAQSILEGLGLKTADHDKPLKVLSGGYKWRVFLAQALVKKPDILMLDEPTNHLDIVSIRWLELFLSNYQGLVILVSHDKRFMDHVCTQILDIDFDTITAYSGNYSAFERARALYMLQKEKEMVAQQKEIAKKQEFIDRFRSKASKARQAQSRIKQIERMEIIEPKKSSRLHPKLRFDITEPGSKEVLTVKNLDKSYGDKEIIKDFSFAVQRGDKIAIIGPNGSGKSTLIKALSLEFPECQKAIKWGFGTSLGYFAQDCGTKIKASDKTVLEWLWQFCPSEPQSYVQGMLGRVLFTGEDAKKSTKNLSGGELSRLYLAYLMMLKPNVLLLDEPTNHLDLECIDTLTQALADFSGTLIIVSHDRTFIDRIALRIVELEQKQISDFLGTYSEFVASRERDYLDAVQETKAGKAANVKDTDKRLSYEEQKKRRAQSIKLKRDRDKVMLLVEETEEKISAIDHQFADENFFKDGDFNKVKMMESEKQSLQTKLDTLILEWDQLETMLKESAEVE